MKVKKVEGRGHPASFIYIHLQPFAERAGMRCNEPEPLDSIISTTSCYSPQQRIVVCRVVHSTTSRHANGCIASQDPLLYLHGPCPQVL